MANRYDDGFDERGSIEVSAGRQIWGRVGSVIRRLGPGTRTSGKNDVDVKEIVNLWAGSSAAAKSMLGRC